MTKVEPITRQLYLVRHTDYNGSTSHISDAGRKAVPAAMTNLKSDLYDRLNPQFTNAAKQPNLHNIFVGASEVRRGMESAEEFVLQFRDPLFFIDGPLAMPGLAIDLPKENFVRELQRMPNTCPTAVCFSHEHEIAQMVMHLAGKKVIIQLPERLSHLSIVALEYKGNWADIDREKATFLKYIEGPRI